MLLIPYLFIRWSSGKAKNWFHMIIFKRLKLKQIETKIKNDDFLCIICRVWQTRGVEVDLFVTKPKLQHNHYVSSSVHCLRHLSWYIKLLLSGSCPAVALTWLLYWLLTSDYITRTSHEHHGASYTLQWRRMSFMVHHISGNLFRLIPINQSSALSNFCQGNHRRPSPLRPSQSASNSESGFMSLRQQGYFLCGVYACIL